MRGVSACDDSGADVGSGNVAAQHIYKLQTEFYCHTHACGGNYVAVANYIMVRKACTVKKLFEAGIAYCIFTLQKPKLAEDIRRCANCADRDRLFVANASKRYVKLPV